MINKKIWCILLSLSLLFVPMELVNADILNEELNIEELVSENVELEELVSEDIESQEIISEEIKTHNIDGYIYIPELEENTDTADVELYNKLSEGGYLGGDYELPKLYYPDNDYLMPTRDQKSYGNCWAYSAIAMAELDSIKNGWDDKSIDLSERHLTYFTYNSVIDPLGGTDGDRNWSDNVWNGGGNYDFAAKTLAMGIGPVEDSYISQLEDKVERNGLKEDIAYVNNYLSLCGAYKINISTNADIVKQSIMERGAVGILYYDKEYYRTVSGNAYYCHDFETLKKQGESMNHAVAFVGWDDNYPATNMKNRYGYMPESDGAWLVRNSWKAGSEFESEHMSKDTYFWMPYEETSLGVTAYTYLFDKNFYDNNYQYDGGFYNKFARYRRTTAIKDSSISLANVFTVANGIEDLKAVSFYTEEANLKYDISIYKNPLPGKAPTSGEKVESATTKGNTLCGGYYRVRLNSPVRLHKGESYSVVIKLSLPEDDESGYTATCVYEGNLDYSPLHSRVSIEKGQSFVGVNQYNSDGTAVRKWSEFSTSHEGNIRIKAFSDILGYAVTFDGNGATDGTMDSLFLNTSEGFYIPECTYKKENYTFNGYNSAADGSGKTYKPGDYIEYTECKDITIYAQWKINSLEFDTDEGKVNVQFDVNSGHIPSTGLVVPNKKNTVFTLCKPTKSGYTFKGWYSGSKKYTKLTKKILQKGDLLLTANYIENKYNLKFKITKPTAKAKVKGFDTKSRKVSYTEKLIIPSQVICSVDGYKLAGWALSADGEVVYKPGDIKSMLTDKKNGKVVLYSVWAVDQ